MPRPKKDVIRINLMIEKELRELVNRFWHEEKHYSEAEAIRELLREGLRSKGYNPPPEN
jgi:metal-responsive CopG/Arc/MetJ family transcriptional regulator